MMTLSRHHSAPVHHREAFTLLEVLVATAVLILVMLLLIQIISSTSETIDRTRKKLDTAAQARLFLDRLGLDLAARVARTDVPVEFLNATGDDSLRFYSEARGYQGNRRVSLVGYRIQTRPDRYYQAERSAPGGDWSTAATLPFGSSALPTPVDVDYDVLAGGIFRMEIGYLKKSDGKLTAVQPANFEDIAAVVVAVAALDSSSRALLSDGQLPLLAHALPDTTEGKDPLTGWKAAVSQPGFASGLPRKVVQSMDIFQRYYLLP